MNEMCMGGNYPNNSYGNMLWVYGRNYIGSGLDVVTRFCVGGIESSGSKTKETIGEAVSVFHLTVNEEMYRAVSPFRCRQCVVLPIV
jgi:hypothetical protein